MELDELHESPRLNQRQTTTESRDEGLVEKSPCAVIDVERSASIKSASRNLDVQQLARIATLPGGFLTDELRRETCTVFYLSWWYKTDDSRANSIKERFQIANEAICIRLAHATKAQG